MLRIRQIACATICLAAATAYGWAYDSYKDEMSGVTVKTAKAKSLNDVEFGFPYQGKQSGTLYLRNHPRHGKEVIFTIEKGQIVCQVSTCQINVKFGEGKPSTMQANRPADHSSTVLFIGGHDRFVSNLKKVKEVRIEVPFYREGVRVFTFDVSDLKWP